MAEKRYYIKIETGTDNITELAEMLRNIANEVEKGLKKGFYPTWEIEIEIDIPEN